MLVVLIERYKKDILPGFYHCLVLLTWGSNTLEHVYRTIPCPHHGLSNHISITPLPVYRPLLQRSQPTVEAAAVWSTDGAAALQSAPRWTCCLWGRGRNFVSLASPDVEDQDVFRSFIKYQLSMS